MATWTLNSGRVGQRSHQSGWCRLHMSSHHWTRSWIQEAGSFTFLKRTHGSGSACAKCPQKVVLPEVL